MIAFVPSFVLSRFVITPLQSKAMRNYFFFSNSLSKQVQKLLKINELSLSKIFASYKLAKIFNEKLVSNLQVTSLPKQVNETQGLTTECVRD